MWQRIQTVFLALVVVSMVVRPFFTHLESDEWHN
jgi:hypothetical protein